MNIVKSTEIAHRDDFPILCNWRRLWVAAEIGVDRGEFANMFLQKWQGTCYIGVDPYDSYPGMPWERNADYLMAVARFERQARRAKLIRDTSYNVASRLASSGWDFIGQQGFDFVYIDGAHDLPSVMTDITNWWPLLTDRGIIAGHDFDQKHQGVMDAVERFFDKIPNSTVYLTHEDDRPSWYVYKGGMPGPDWKRC